MEANIEIEWQPGIGDPTITGWVTVFGYFVTAVICWLASAASKKRPIPSQSTVKKESRFWAAVALLMVLLGFNKQLDLQSFLTQTARYFAHSGGWYDLRQTIQILFIFCLLGAVVIAAFVLMRVYQTLAAEIKMASLGLLVLGAFIIIRAASFHHVDRFLGEYTLGLRWNGVLELGSIAFVAAAGICYWRHWPFRAR